MTLDEIMTKAKWIYENVESINSLKEAQQAVRDASSMIFYLAKHIKEGEVASELPHVGSFDR